MSIDVNVYLRNKGGRTSRAKSKLSTKETHNSKRGRTSATQKDTDNMGVLSTFASTGNVVKSGLMKFPIIREVMAATKMADTGINFVTAIYQAHSGENMVSGNIRATSKIAATFGMSYLEAAIGNELYRKPTIQRQNYMLDYGKELYNLNIENNKNKFS